MTDAEAIGAAYLALIAALPESKRTVVLELRPKTSQVYARVGKVGRTGRDEVEALTALRLAIL